MPLSKIDHKEDVEKYQAKEIKTDVVYPHCIHNQIKLSEDRTELRCPCGVAFGGSQLGTLYKLLTHTS